MTGKFHRKIHDLDSSIDHVGVSGAVLDEIMKFDANGLPIISNLKHIFVSRAVPETGSDYIEIGKLTQAQGSFAIIVAVSSIDAGNSGSDLYYIVGNYDETLAAWQLAYPIQTAEPHSQLCVMIDDDELHLRLIAISSTINPVTVKVQITDVGVGNAVFTAASGTGSMGLPGTVFPSALITQVAGSVHMHGQLSMNTEKILDVVDPTALQGAATKNYVDNTIASAIGDNVSKRPVHAATIGVLPNNTRTGDVLTADAVGEFPTIDGVLPVLNQEYLVKNEGGGVSHINNGIYELTVLGDGGTAWELTRRDDMEGGENASGAAVPITEGTIGADTTFKCFNNIGSDVVNTDTLEFKFWGQTVDHANLKNVTADQHHVKYTDAEALLAAWANIDTKNFENLLIDGDFEGASISPYWTNVGSMAKSIENVIVKIGAQSAKLSVPAPIPTVAYMYQDVVDFTRYQGREVTLNVWARADSGNAFDSMIEIDDGVGVTTSSVIPKDDAWHLMSITRTIDAAATRMRAILYLRKSSSISTTDVAYFDGCMFVEGDSGPAYGDCSPLYQDISGIFKGALTLAGVLPVDADIATWNTRDRGFGQFGSRDFLIWKDVGGIRYKELSNDGIVTLDNGDSPYSGGTLKTWNTYLCDATAGVIAFNLPVALNYEGMVFRIKKTDASANAVTITPNGIETIDGAASKVLSTQYENIELLGDGSGWHVLYPIAATHEKDGVAEIDVTDLAGVLTEDQHIIDAEAVSAMGAKGDGNPLNHDRFTDGEVDTIVGTHAALPNAHHTPPTLPDDIENGGSEEMSLAGLSGEPADTVNKTLFDAQTILRATADDTPTALTVAEQRLVGRITAGNIEALTVAQVQTLLGIVSEVTKKAGIVAGAAFAGNPKKFTVTFNTAMPDNNYAVSVTGEDSRNWTIESKAAAGFTINANSNLVFANNVFWIARPINDP